MKRTLILSILWIALPLIAHTQKLYKDSLNSKRLDSLTIERRLVVLGVRSLDYYIDINENQRAEIKALTQLNAFNLRYIEQLEQQNEGLNEVLNDELRSKKKWRNATLLIGGVYVLTILGLAQL